MEKIKYTSVAEYIEQFPKEIQKMLRELQAIIKQAAPKSTEVISYNMPAYKQNSVLVYFAAYKNHIGFYPTSSPMRVFKDRLEGYKTSKGAVQFPLDQPLPKKLIEEIVRYRMAEDAEKSNFKSTKKGK